MHLYSISYLYLPANNLNLLVTKLYTKAMTLGKLQAPYKNYERYYGIQKLEEGEHWWLLENVDGENALLTPNGEIVVDFGNVTKDSFLGKPVLEYVISNEVCCFIIEGETENEVYVVKNQAKA